MILDHTEKVILNEIRVNLRSQINQHIIDVMHTVIPDYANDVKQKVLKIVKKDSDRVDEKLAEISKNYEELASKFNF